MRLSWLCEQDAWVIILLLFIAMTLSGEVACWIGKRLSIRSTDSGRGHFISTQTSLLAVVSLLVSFTFGMSIQRFEERRKLMIEDANMLQRLYWNSNLLPEPQRQTFKSLLKQYVDLHIVRDKEGRGVTGEQILETVDQLEVLNRRMRDAASAISRETESSRSADDVRQSLAEVSFNMNRRVYAFNSRVPDPIVWLLLGMATAGTAVIGLSAGLGNHRGIPARFVMTILMCGAIYVILDLDRPIHGLFKSDQAPLIRLQKMIESDRETMAAVNPQ